MLATRLRACAYVAIACAGAGVPLHAQQNLLTGETIKALQVQPNVYVLMGAGGNVAVQVGPDGVVLVDSGAAATADAIVSAVKKLTDQPIRYIINTGPDSDHVGGNEKVAKAGQSLFSGNNPGAGANAFSAALSNAGAASIVGPENLVARMSTPTGGESAYPTVAWPSEAFAGKQKNLYLNREAIQIMHQPSAHSDSDSIVFFRRSDVLVTGDIFDMTRFPIIDVEKGGSIQGEIDALNRLIELAVPAIPLPWQEGGTQVIPGHGRISEEAELVEYRDMITIIRDRVRDLAKRDMAIDEIIKANPTQGFNGRFGSDSGPWTTKMFVEAVHQSLLKEKR